MERVVFINNEDQDDLIVSFAISDEEDSGGVVSLILLRTPKYEFALEVYERGVEVSHESWPEREDDLLRRIRLGTQAATIDTSHQHYELDLSRVDSEEVQEACRILRKMNFDNSFNMETA